MQDPEFKKTITFVLVAGMALLVAWEPWRPGPIETKSPDEVGQRLFPDFNDPLAAKSLEIVKFNEADAAIRDFQVSQVNGVWSIPSHNNYPADAQQHMADAATALMDLKILGLASDRPGDQKEYGVITPDPNKLKVGMTGVGMRVTVKDAKDKVLADLVIGKEVKDQPSLHYVRRADRDHIYTVDVKTKDLSTKFDDWIEKDLLKLNVFDVRNVELNDYSTITGVGPDGRPALRLDQRSETELAYDDAKGAWNLVEMKEFGEKGEPKPVVLAADEELNTQKLNDLKNALDDLQIVDVERKPAGLSRDLRASDDFLKNNEDAISLQERGFIAAAKPGEPVQVYSTEGEVNCTAKDGVRYVLRFGDIAGTSMPDEPAKEGEKPKSAAPNRYLFAMAQFDESQIPKPELKPPPGDKPEGEKPAAETTEKPGTPPKDAPPDEKPDPQKPAAKPAAKPADKPAPKPAAKQVPQKKTAAQETQPADATKDDAKAAPADKTEPAESKDATKTDEAKPADKPPAVGDEKKQPEKPASPEELEKLAVERENKRLQDEYDEAVKRGQEKVKELNDRFADWYYIISDEVYQKIHLGRDAIIKKKADPKSETLDDLNNLEEGVKIGPGAKDEPK